MSGGSYDYAYNKIESIIYELQGNRANLTPLRRAFLKHLKLVTKALHDIEWVDSGDCGEGDEVEAIEAVLGKKRALSMLVEDAKELIKELEKYTNDV